MSTSDSVGQYRRAPWDTHGALPLLRSVADGVNRSPRPPLISADDDLDAAWLWLKGFQTSHNTYAAYRKELNRLLMWATLERGKSLSELDEDDFGRFFAFLANPTPKERWQSGVRRSLSDPRWRPFTGPLGEVSQQYNFRALSSLMAFLTGARWLSLDPLAQAPMSPGRWPTVRPPYQQRERWVDVDLDREMWAAVLAHVGGMPRLLRIQKARFRRARWFVLLCEATGPTSSELAGHRMGSLHCVPGGAAPGGRSGDRWWWRICGRAGRIDYVALPDALVDELRLYRSSLGLSELPEADDRFPLVMRLQPKNRAISKPMTRTAVYDLAKQILHETASEIEFLNPSLALHLRTVAAVRWFRQAAISGRRQRGDDWPDVQAFARHASLDSTKRFVGPPASSEAVPGLR